VNSVLEGWFGSRPRLPRRAALLLPRNDAWRDLAPGFPTCARWLRDGLPFHSVLDRRVRRGGRVDLHGGATVYLPQAHQILPRVARLMAALRAALFGPRSEEVSYLFLVDGRGREGMGLHHDGDVDNVWIQLEGARTATWAAPVKPGTPEELPSGAPLRNETTRDLPPGSLLYLPPRTPHRVVCRGRSLALSLTWSRTRAARESLARWELAPGRPMGRPGASKDRLFTQVPALARRGRLLLPGGVEMKVPGMSPKDGAALIGMPVWKRQPRLSPLEACGLLDPRELPLWIRPADPRSLDGWNF
jgi:hypothetical protein